MNVDAAHVSATGAVLVFRSNAAISGFNNGGGFEQIYRYDAESQELDCLSCAPAGSASSGDAHMSYNNAEGNVKANGTGSDPVTTIETRGMSADGSRVFFDTPAPLVPQATNGVRNVYEWEDGTIYLISSGSSPEASEYLDSDTSGENVFFATSSPLVPGDTDGSFDIYDARMPRLGDNPPPTQTPCKGSVCQGPPSVPQLLAAPASETFSGAGNLPAQPEKQAVSKPPAKKKATKKKARKTAKKRGKRAKKSDRGGK